MTNLAHTLSGMQIRIDVEDERVYVDTFVFQPLNATSSEFWLAKVIKTIGTTPQTKEQLLALMQIIGREIWQHHLRQSESKQGEQNGD
jgi:hypothetical protein